jgi:DNA (cytosine-5)-methyltransferase 1
MGYHRAGFEVVGVDIEPQRRYPFEFIQADALDYIREHGHEFDAIHASPPCQRFCSLNKMHNAKEHPDLVAPCRSVLIGTGRLYVIENVPRSPLINPVTLCGTMFGLGTADAELWRHRLFESNVLLAAPECSHREKGRVIGVYGGHGRDRRRTVNTQDFSTEQRREAMGIDWMTGAELSQAIPPAYTEFIGKQLLRAVDCTSERAKEGNPHA